MRSSGPDPVKVVAAVLWRDAAALEAAVARCAALWGEVDFQGRDHPFDVTEYYEQEMGPGLLRRIVSFAALAPAESLTALKLAAIAVEDALRAPACRTVNIDVGYLDVHKLVLASTKPNGPKLYLGQGIYADMTLRYERGRFEPFPWAFADFRDGRYDADLLRVRERYKLGLRHR
jgi:hypothetical protein